MPEITSRFDEALRLLDKHLHGDKFTEPNCFLQCRDAIAALWWLESNGGKSDLAIRHNNLAGLKYRRGIANERRKPADYTDWENITDSYFSFDSVAEFVECFFDFIARPVYAGLEDHANDPQGFVKHLVSRGFCASLPNMPEGMTKQDEYWRRCKDIIDSGRIPQMVTPDF